MKKKYAIYLVGVFLFIGLIYGGYRCKYVADIAAKRGSLDTSMRYLSEALGKYYVQNRKWPDNIEEVRKNIEDADFLLLDPISEKTLLYYPNTKFGSKEVLIAQPEPYRTHLRPFGEMRRVVLLANGEKRELYHQDALSDPRKYDFSKNE